MRVERTLQRIERAFAEAVDEGELVQAEGWIAVAAWLRDRAAATAAPVPAGR